MMADPVEIAADLEHQQWAHWTRYMLANLTPENIERWKKQCETDYAGLSESEKESDRTWARRHYAGIEAAGYRIAGPEPTIEMLDDANGVFCNILKEKDLRRAWTIMRAKLPLYGSE